MSPGLLELHLRDLGVIAEANVAFSAGLNVVTGETGVGKTLLVTSLALLTGSRGHARLVREGAPEALVQAVVQPSAGLSSALAARGLPDAAEIVLVRRLSADGRSRAWVDGQLAPITTLGEIGEFLVQVHGQGAGFALARPASQLAAIDALAGNDELLELFRTSLHSLRELQQERERLSAGESVREREAELLAYQIAEIDRAALQPDEEERLGAALARLEHAERLGAIGEQVGALAGADGAAGALAQAHRIFEEAASLDQTATELVSRLGSVAAEASELARDIRGWTETLEADPAQLEPLRERKALIGNLKRKYGGSLADVLDASSTAHERLAELTEAEERVGSIGHEVSAAHGRTEELAMELSKRRRRAAKRLTKLVSAELPMLALPNAVFDVRHEHGDLTESGADRIEFVFSSSASGTPDGIGKVASGGELSRAMIAVTLALAQTDGVGVLIFDEADQGIGGEAALDVGRRLARLGRTHQVLVVSHLPQIAAFADRHIAVRRNGDDVEIEVLSDAERLGEISRMLAGLESSELARAHAAELLELALAERHEDATAKAG